MLRLAGRLRWLLLGASALFLLASFHFYVPSADLLDRANLPGIPTRSSRDKVEAHYKATDHHPIAKLIAEAETKWREYDEKRSLNFAATVQRYRSKNGRHPPPGFATWYRFARKRNIHNPDDFDQIMDDLRPFWSVEPRVLRNLAAHGSDDEDNGVSTLHVRGGKVVGNSFSSWRSDNMADMLKNFVKYLPDMDIPSNRLDQPRVVVPWDDLQKALEVEVKTRVLGVEATDSFSANQSELAYLGDQTKHDDRKKENAGWFSADGKPYMDLVKPACPPESPARDADRQEAADALWRGGLGGVVTNFNLSSDLCTMGPNISDQHGLMFTASTIRATKRLVPIFGECKVNVNNDILFPANMYWKTDKRYEYDGAWDSNWEKKSKDLIWRGVTSGGVQLEDNWQRMHRQRLVQAVNATVMQKTEVPILAATDETAKAYVVNQWQPSPFLRDHVDAAFVESWGCIPEKCPFYDGVFKFKDAIDLGRHFQHQYLLDVDGHSFSGRFRAFLLSRSLPFKATIFREWHDSRLFAWRHFVPMDNRFTDIYTLLTYFLGVGSTSDVEQGGSYVPSHQAEARRLALQGREWAHKVLRKADMEIYLFRLLLEYGRLLDDNRSHIGYSGDGSEVDRELQTSAGRWRG